MNKGLTGHKKLGKCNAPIDTLLQKLQKMGVKKRVFGLFFGLMTTVIKRHICRSIIALQNMLNSVQVRIHCVYAKRLVIVVYGIVAMDWRLATMFLRCSWNAVCATMEHNQLAWRWM